MVLCKPILIRTGLENSFFNSVDLPPFNEEQANRLESPITQDGLYITLNLLPNNTAPGPNDLPAEFYKHF